MNENDTPFESPEEEEVRRRLAVMYAAPADPAYWSELQIRILSRIADSDPGLWWVFLGRWARGGIVAAALALMAAGIASVSSRDVENQIAYQSLDDRIPINTLERINATVGLSEEEAALRYVLSIPEGQGR